MAKVLQHRRDTTANLASVSGAIGEFFMDTTKNTLVVMDGTTNGGHPLQLELTSGTNIKTINGTSLLGSGDITISGGSADFSAVAEDVLPALDGVYDLGSSTEQWYDLFVSNSVTIDGGSLTGNATGLVTSTMLLGDLLVTTNTITPDASTALQYNGDQGIVDILGNLDVSTGDWLLPGVVETTVTSSVGDVFILPSPNTAKYYDGTTMIASVSGDPNYHYLQFNNSSHAPGFLALLNQTNIGSFTIDGYMDPNNFSFTFNGTNVGAVIDQIEPTLVRWLKSSGTWVAPGTFNEQFLVTGGGEFTSTIDTPSTPLTTGTEGAVRYNKDVGVLQLYTDSWNGVLAGTNPNQMIYVDGTDPSTYITTLELNKKYWFDIDNFAISTLPIPDGTEVGQTVTIFYLQAPGGNITLTGSITGGNAFVDIGYINYYIWTGSTWIRQRTQLV